jgi:hypothetical protein
VYNIEVYNFSSQPADKPHCAIKPLTVNLIIRSIFYSPHIYRIRQLFAFKEMSGYEETYSLSLVGSRLIDEGLWNQVVLNENFSTLDEVKSRLKKIRADRNVRIYSYVICKIITHNRRQQINVVESFS